MSLSPRQTAIISLVAVAGTALVIWDHRNNLAGVMAALQAPGSASQKISTAFSAAVAPQNQTTNSALPSLVAGRAGAVNLASVPLTNSTAAFGSIWDSLAGGSIN